MAPLARSERASISDSVIGRLGLLVRASRTPMRSSSVRARDVTWFRFADRLLVCIFGGYMQIGIATGVCDKECAMMRRTRARTGQNRGLPVMPWVITLPFIPFFCVVKVREAAVAVSQLVIFGLP
jgi:hypothetical protein